MESAPREEERPGAAEAPARHTEEAADASDAGGGGEDKGVERGGAEGPRQPTSQDDPLYQGVPDDRVGG